MFPTVDTEENIAQVTSVNSTSSSPSKHAQSSTDNSQPKQNNKESVTMLIKEMVFCVALALTTYGALHNTSSKVSKHPRAVRFFDSDSLVTDWYKGQLSIAHDAINYVDISFVMYYAPWDAESQYVRAQFEEAAALMSDRVRFSAINCWNPTSECRLQHNKIPSWPILIAYTHTPKAVLYKGPRDAHSMVKFLELMMQPLDRISSTSDLVHLLSICDAVAVGYTPLHETSKYYNVWYYVALKVRELDIINEICFGVVTSEDLAVDLGVNGLPSAKLMLWNDTKEYQLENGDIQSWNESSLLSWVLDNFAQPVARIMPMWKKSFNFERYIDGNPLLVLFTPFNPLYEQLPSYSLLREVAMEYYDCNNNDSHQWTSELIRLQQVQRLMYQQKDFTKFCDNYKFKAINRKTGLQKDIISQNNKYPWVNSTQKNSKSGFFDFLLKGGLDITKMASGDGSRFVPPSFDLLEECSTGMERLYENYEQCQSFEEDVELGRESVLNKEFRTTMLPLEDDPLSPENLIQGHVRHFCKLMKFAQNWGPPVAPKKPTSANVSNIRGLSCAHNFSLNMVAVDSVRNHHFAESLGIDISNKKDKTAVIILDSKHETQYLMSEEYSANSIRDFIYNFTNKSLKRFLRSTVDASQTHYFGSDGLVDQMGIDNNTVYITDLTTRTFRKVVRDPGKMTMVLICSGPCPAHSSRALLQAARLLAGAGAPARAARVDAARHDLPWHYTQHRLPAVLVFTSHRGESDSRRYPMSARLTGSGLAALALRALGPPHNLRGRLTLCASQGNKEKKTCLRDIKEHITTVIGRNLKYWRHTDRKELKDALFKRLQHLNQVSLELSVLDTSELNEINKKTTLLNSLNNLSKIWDIDVSILRQNVSES